MEKVSSSHEDYLEAIVMLGGTPDSPVRSVDIAKKLGVSKTAVSKAITSLKDKGMLDQPFYGDVTLTEDGFEYGKSILRRHNSLIVFLVEEIGLSEELAEEEACKMEHAISDESFELWLKYFKRIGIEVD
ncbi:MAG: metal-dependent transcriptional regulator [Anaerotardibacter sp.]